MSVPDGTTPKQEAGASGVGGSAGAVNRDASGGQAGAPAEASPGGQAGQPGTGGTSTAGSGGTQETDGGCKTTCDCDGDGVESETCGGTDCDDHDSDVKPGQTKYFEDPMPGSTSFDYNCDGKIETDPSEPLLSCASLAGIGCPTDQGFIDPELPSCGNTGNWGECQKGPVGCKATKLETLKMRCH
jgi:hypothetical protein